MKHDSKGTGFRDRHHPCVRLTTSSLHRPEPPSTFFSCKLFYVGRKVGSELTLRDTKCSQKWPTFLLLEGLDWARVVHHGGVQLISSVMNQMLRFEKQNSRIHWKLRWSGVGVNSAPILPDDLTSDAQTASNTCLSSACPPPPHLSSPLLQLPPFTAVVMVTGGRRRSGDGPVVLRPDLLTPDKLRKMTGELHLKWTDKDKWLDRQSSPSWMPSVRCCTVESLF